MQTAIVAPMTVVPDDIAAALGRFTIVFAQAEREWSLGPWRLKELPYEEKQQRASEIKNNPARLDKVRATFAELCEPLDSAVADKLKARMDYAVSLAKELNTARNILIHGFWHVNSRGSLIVKLPGKPPIVEPTAELIDRWTSWVRVLRDHFHTTTLVAPAEGEPTNALIFLARAMAETNAMSAEDDDG